MILREAEDGTTNEKVPEGQTQTCQQKHVLRRDSPVLEERAPALSQEDHQPQGRKHANPEGEIQDVLKKLVVGVGDSLQADVEEGKLVLTPTSAPALAPEEETLLRQTKRKIARIRKDLSDPSGKSISIFVAADQLLKGAALNAVLAGKPVSNEQRPSIGCNIKWKPRNEPDYYGHVKV